VFAHPAHELHVEMDVVHSEQLPPENLAYPIEMKQIRDGEGLAGVAAAGGVDGSVHAAIGGAPQIAKPSNGICEMARALATRRSS
jgi:hypothetical protein